MAQYTTNLHPQDNPTDVLNPNIVEENIPQDLLNSFLKSSGANSAGSPAAPFNDADTFPINQTVLVSIPANVANVPEQVPGVCFTYSWTNDSNQSNYVQIYATVAASNPNHLWMRTKNPQGTFNAWARIDISGLNLNSFFIPSGKNTARSPAAPFNDADTFPINQTVLVSIPANVANVPEQVPGVCFTYSWTNDSNQSNYVQIYATVAASNPNHLWMRTKNPQGTFNAWDRIDISGLNLNSFFIPSGKNTAGSPAAPFNDADTFPINQTVLVSIPANVANVPEQVPGVCFTYSWTNDPSQSSYVQLYVTVAASNPNHLWMRTKNPQGTFNAWARMDAQPDRVTPMYSARIFQRVGCIGDSYTMGYIRFSETDIYPNPPNYSWPHYESMLTGQTWSNFGMDGASSKTWIDGTISRQDEVLAKGNKCQAYVIGFGINDASGGSSSVPLGTESDIGTDANSFYAYYYKVIQQCLSVNSMAKIICNTCPRVGIEALPQYNDAIKIIVQQCKTNNQPVYVCDLADPSTYNNANFYTNPVFLNDFIYGHFTAIGYQYMAECYMRVLSDLINAHISDFQNVVAIPFDEVT